MAQGTLPSARSGFGCLACCRGRVGFPGGSVGADGTGPAGPPLGAGARRGDARSRRGLHGGVTSLHRRRPAGPGGSCSSPTGSSMPVALPGFLSQLPVCSRLRVVGPAVPGLRMLRVPVLMPCWLWRTVPSSPAGGLAVSDRPPRMVSRWRACSRPARWRMRMACVRGPVSHPVPRALRRGRWGCVPAPGPLMPGRWQPRPRPRSLSHSSWWSHVVGCGGGPVVCLVADTACGRGDPSPRSPARSRSSLARGR